MPPVLLYSLAAGVPFLVVSIASRSVSGWSPTPPSRYWPLGAHPVGEALRACLWSLPTAPLVDKVSFGGQKDTEHCTAPYK